MTIHSDNSVTWNSDNRVFTVRFASPPANALECSVLEGLDAALDAFERSSDRVLVLVSDVPGFFMAGGDIKTISQASDDYFAEYSARVRVMLDRLAKLDRPSIAAIEGRALGGGLELALAATLRVASVNARLALPEVQLGLIPGAGGTQRLPPLVGRGRALDMLLTGRPVDATEGYAIGLINRMTAAEEAESTAIVLARELVNMSGPALTAVLRCIDDAGSLPQHEGIATEATRLETLFSTGEAREGLTAFLAKRTPDYA